MVQFTLPESNTTWKFQALANTEDMKYGMLTKEVISSKPLMVLPNLPRFMRQGDEVSVSTQVINNSKVTINGRVSLELFDPDNRPTGYLSDKITKAVYLVCRQYHHRFMDLPRTGDHQSDWLPHRSRFRIRQ